MGLKWKWKPIEATEIKDIKIIREVIAQVRKPIPPEVYARHEELSRKLKAAWRPIPAEEKARAWGLPLSAVEGKK